MTNKQIHLHIAFPPFPKLPRIHPFHPLEEAGEGGGFGEMEAVGDLGNAERGLAQKERGLHQQQLVDVVHNGAAARHLADNARKVCSGNAAFVGSFVWVFNGMNDDV